MKKIDISIIIPMYNEEKSALKTLNEIKKTISKIKKNFEIIVVNDCSSDKTSSILKNVQGIRIIEHDFNKGYGASLKDGMLIAKGEYILITDADGTYPIADIPKLVDQCQKYDMVVGARTGQVAKIPLIRKPAKFFLNSLANYISGTKIPDLNSGFRIFKKSLGMRFFGLYPDGFSFTTTITIASLTNGYKVKFIPVNYFKRQGKSSIKPIKDFIGFTTLILRLTIYFKPLNIFVPVSLTMMLISLIKIIYDLTKAGFLGVGGVVFMLAAIQILFMGLLADLVIKRTERA
jgi:glycosyltransferase involved in cell wall biosynthesis